MQLRKLLLNILVTTSLFALIFTACGNNIEQDKNSPPPMLQKYSSPYGYDINESDIIGQFSTRIIDKSLGRINNLRVTCEKINGRVVNPGEIFSFNNVVGEATRANGYKLAIVLDEKGRKRIGYGGGVCQVSSTLYNAVKNSGLKIVERHSHKRDVGYLRQGEDAAINYGVQDLKFMNNKKYPIKITAKVEGREKVVVVIEKLK